MAPKTRASAKPKVYKFHVDGEKKSGATREFYLLDEELNLEDEKLSVPKKLGDGNFGIVFDASATSNTESYALKVLYDHSVPDPKVSPVAAFEIQRIEAELKIGLELPRRLKFFVDGSTSAIDPDFLAIASKPGDYIVLPIAFDFEFKDQASAANLERLDIKLSKYAYLMEKFDCSLKDLVEGTVGTHQATPNEADKSAASENGGKNEGEALVQTTGKVVLTGGGYGRLRQATVEERERSAIPVLEQVARGLQTLHAASFRHRDLKPANVYYKRAANKVEFRLGDLGFLDPKDDPVRAGSAVVTQAIGIGTKHYRSIEQIDFSDTAECDVAVDKKSGTAILTTRDPKFLETNIGEGDLAYFAKSSSRRHVTVKSLEKDFERREVRVSVELSQPEGPGEQEGQEAKILVNDRNTQVAFLKNPTAKTDLFGLAAILYDIVSIGDSPERFYELLRRFDVDGVSIEESIIRLYDTWQAGIIDDADVSAIFSRVNGGEGRSGTVHVQVLRFLLSCMMSNASDSYYRTFDLSNADRGPIQDSDFAPTLAAVDGWARVILEIKELEEILAATGYNEVERNVLTRTGRSQRGTRTEALVEVDQVKFGDALNSYRSGQGPVAGARFAEEEEDWEGDAEILVARWVLTAALITKMDEGLNRHMTSGSEGLPYMYSLAQEHLAVNSSSVLFRRSVLDDDSESLIASMRYRDPLLTRIRPFSHRFEPIWWRYGARRVMLDVRAGHQGEGDGKSEAAAAGPVEADVEYADFAFSRQETEVGDFILPSAGGSSIVLRVCEVRDGLLGLQVCLDDGQKNADGNPDNGGGDQEINAEDLRAIKDGYLVRNPDRVDYYAGMLAIYMFHFLVSDGSKAGCEKSDFPGSAYGRLQDFPLRFSTNPADGSSGRDSGDWRMIKKYTLELIMWLSLGGFYFDPAGRKWGSEKEKWRCVHQEVVHWCDAVHAFTKTRELVVGLNLLSGIGQGDRSRVEEAAKNGVEGVSSEEWEAVCEAYIESAKAGEKQSTERTKEGGRLGRALDKLPWNKSR